jgi:hypothetical protein
MSVERGTTSATAHNPTSKVRYVVVVESFHNVAVHAGKVRRDAIADSVTNKKAHDVTRS